MDGRADTQTTQDYVHSSEVVTGRREEEEE